MVSVSPPKEQIYRRTGDSRTPNLDGVFDQIIELNYKAFSIQALQYALIDCMIGCVCLYGCADKGAC